MVQPVRALEHPKCHFRSKWPKCPWSTLGWPKVKIGQNHPKTIFFIFLHQSRVTRRFLSILTKFDLRLTLGGTKNSNFDPTFKMGLYQCHCKDYQIPFPTTIHGSKSKLKRLRYFENHVWRVSSFLEAIMFDPTVIFSISLVFWKLDI